MYELWPYFTNDGTVGLFSKVDDDIYHSTYGALTEALQKFILPGRLEEYILTHNEVKILDICYGIGYNTKTALNLFIKNFYNSKRKKAKIFSSIQHNIATIDTDNKLNIEKINNPSKSINNHDINIDTIGSDNIFQDPEVVKYKNESKNGININSINKISTCNKILIDAVDIDKILINISPFILNKAKNNSVFQNYVLKKYFSEITNDEKIRQIQKIKKIKAAPISKKYRLSKEVPMIIYYNLLKSNPKFYDDPILRAILSQKKYTPFLSRYMINFAKFYSNLGYKDIKNENKLPFLHNIYYRYVSKSYKNMENLLKNVEIDINFYKDDARRFITSTSNKYNFIFLDAFTPAKCPALWTVQFIKQLYDRLDYDGIILTYSNSAAIRNAFLQNGFAVGKTYDKTIGKFIGTVATKDSNLIEYELDDKDIDLINSKAGICFKDETLSLNNNIIIMNREDEISRSNLATSSSVLKGHKHANIKSV